MRSLTYPLLAFALVALAGVSLAEALLADPGDKPAGGQPATRKEQNKASKQLAVTPEREAAVTTFVQRNHPELAEILTHLKANQQRAYEQAIRELHRVTERLAGIQERDSSLYELEVAAWTAQSRVQLLAARLRMGESDAVRKELREALGAQADARLAVLKHQRAQTAERLAKTDGEINRLENNRSEFIDKQMQTLEQSLAGKTGSKAAGAKQQFTGKPLNGNPAGEKRTGQPTTSVPAP